MKKDVEVNRMDTRRGTDAAVSGTPPTSSSDASTATATKTSVRPATSAGLLCLGLRGLMEIQGR